MASALQRRSMPRALFFERAVNASGGKGQKNGWHRDKKISVIEHLMSLISVLEYQFFNLGS
jgi:hypothetical protein